MIIYHLTKINLVEIAHDLDHFCCHNSSYKYCNNEVGWASLGAALNEESRPSNYEANSHKTLTWAKKGGSYAMALKKQTGFPFWCDPILFPWAISYLIFSALEYIFTSLKYEFEGIALTPSCKGLEVDLVD